MRQWFRAHAAPLIASAIVVLGVVVASLLIPDAEAATVKAKAGTWKSCTIYKSGSFEDTTLVLLLNTCTGECKWAGTGDLLRDVPGAPTTPSGKTLGAWELSMSSGNNITLCDTVGGRAWRLVINDMLTTAQWESRQ
jgi:hypothetical protein